MKKIKGNFKKNKVIELNITKTGQEGKLDETRLRQGPDEAKSKI